MIEWQILFESAINITVLLLVLVALSYSIIKLNKRLTERSISYRGLLVLLHLVVSVSLLGLLLQPSLQSEQPVSAVLYTITNQQPPDELNPNEYVYLANRQNLAEEYLSAKFRARYKQQIIYHPEQLLLKEPGLSQLTIVGDGLLASQLALFQQQALAIQPSRKLTGVINPQWNSKLELGNELKIQATFQSAEPSIFQVKLINPAQQVEDEISVIHNEFFTLKATPKLAGNHLFQLMISDKEQNIVSEQWIPVEVKQSRPAKILVMQSSPSFESKQIQNWAATFGAELLIRTRISQNKFMTRATNLSQKIDSDPKLLVNRTILSQFDLLIVDARELQFFDQQQLSILTEAIENGLGILVRADGSLASNQKNQSQQLLSSFNIEPLNQEIRVDLVAHDQVDSQSILADSVLLSASPLFNISQTSKPLSPLIITPQGYVVVAQKNIGLGKISVSVIKQSYQLKTSDQSKAFSQLWSHIIQHTARKYNSKQLTIENEYKLLLKNRKTDICINSFDKEPKKTHAKQDSKSEANYQSGKIIQAEIFLSNQQHQPPSTKINLQTNAINPNEFCGSYWPTHAGWHKVSVSEVESYIYIYSSQSWPAAQQNMTVNATQARIAAGNPTISNNRSQKIINDWYYWLLIVGCSSLIWVERKFWPNR